MAFVSVQAQSYVKVTSAPGDWSGDYLIVYEAGNVAFNGSLTTLDAASNTISVKITNGEIAADETTNAAKFTIAKSGTAYTVKSALGYYIGQTADANGLKSNKTTTYANDLTLNSDGSVNVVSAKAYLRYNATSGQNRFRYYKSSSYSGQKAIALYKYTEAAGETPVAPAAPTLTASCNFVGSKKVEISCATADAEIYYTTDGTEPTEESEVYEEAFEITETTTVKAIAVNEGGASDVATAVYTRVAATPTITPASTTFNQGESLFVTIATETEDAKIHYTTDGTDPTEKSELYGGPFEITETTTVKAIAVKEGCNNSEVAEATFTAIDPNAKDATLSFADMAQRTSYSASQQVWEQNGITFTNDKASSTNAVADYANPVRLYKSSNIKIEATREISKIEFECASGYVISITDATTAGTKVTVNVSPASKVYEVKGLSAQVRLNSLTVTYATGEEAPITAAPKLPASTNFEEEFEVEITAEDGATIYYTTDNTKPTTASTLYNTPFTVTETTTVKAIAVKDGVESAVAEATYTKVRLIDLTNCTVAEAIEAYKNGQTGTATITGYIVGAADNTLNKAEFTSETAVMSNILIAGDPNEKDVDNCMPIKMASGTAVRKALNLGENKHVYKKKVVVVGELVAYFGVAGMQDVENAGLYWTVSDAGYATLYLGYKAEIPTTVNAYIIESTTSTHAIMTEVEGVVAANTGLILEGEGEHLFNITAAAATANVDGNLLRGTVADTKITEAGYVLAMVDGEVGLYKAEMKDDGWLNNANKAYLPATEANSVSFYGFRFGEETTGVAAIEIRNENEVIFDLAGRRVSEITAPGIYIINGKKVIK